MCIRAYCGAAADGPGVRTPHESYVQKMDEAWSLVKLFSPLVWTLLFAVFAVTSWLIWG